MTFNFPQEHFLLEISNFLFTFSIYFNHTFSPYFLKINLHVIFVIVKARFQPTLKPSDMIYSSLLIPFNYYISTQQRGKESTENPHRQRKSMQAQPN